jgi:hypothetical protein
MRNHLLFGMTISKEDSKTQFLIVDKIAFGPLYKSFLIVLSHWWMFSNKKGKFFSRIASCGPFPMIFITSRIFAFLNAGSYPVLSLFH